MLRITVQLGQRIIGTLDICRVRVSKGVADYRIKFVNGLGEEHHATLFEYPCSRRDG